MLQCQAFVAFTLLTALSLTAQTSTLRAEVDDLPGTPRRFVVAGAPSIQLTSTQVNLASIYDSGSYELTVRRTVGPPSTTVLEVSAARRIVERFEIDDGLRLGTTATFEVRGPAGAQAAVLLTSTARTSFLPVPGAGTWLLGSQAALVGQGTIRNDGSLEIDLALPVEPRLVGLQITAQAGVITGSSLFLTVPDAATVVR